ncbi:hypothetical protein [Nitrosopumilus sp.]|uniref:hypothetical protein n=1 Tax=Nitrosopumilus sp. TaxID=2024843 RepID=UPI003D12E562
MDTKNKVILISISAAIIAATVSVYIVQTQSTDTEIVAVPVDLLHVIIDGKIKPYEIPLNAPYSENEPTFVLVPNKSYPELYGAIQVALYNVEHLPNNLENVQVSGYFDPESPDWYYPEQGRTKQVIFVEDVMQLEPVDLGNKYTTQQLRDRYDQIHKEFEDIKEEFVSGNISQEQYVSTLESLAGHELELFQDVKEHTFERDEMTQYNFWHRGVMKFPTTIEQEISKNNF